MNRTGLPALWNRFSSFFIGTPSPSGILRGLIHEDEVAIGYDRIGVRAKAKKWLISNGETLVARDVLLARDHFGYLLPENWGV